MIARGVRRLGLWSLLCAGLLALGCCAVAAGESSPGPAWRLSVAGQPTNVLTSGGRYVITLTNVGGAPSSGPVALTITLPAGVSVGNSGLLNLRGWVCAEGAGGSLMTCSWGSPVAPFGQAGVMEVPVVVAAPAGAALTAHFVVSGGGAPVAQASLSGVVGEPVPAFGFTDFSVQSLDLAGAPDTQAGDHPNALVVAFDTTTNESSGTPAQYIKDIEFDLPPGFGADPQVVAQCKIVEVWAQGCPASSRIGTLYLNDDESTGFGTVLPIYNVVPEHGYPAEFAIYHPELGKPAIMYGSVRGASDYGIHLSLPAVPTAIELHDVLAVVYGDPRGVDGSGDLRVPFMTNPSECGQPLTAKLEADTYQEPEHWIKAESQEQPVANCDLLQFDPSISLTPSTTQADEPAGFAIDVHNPQTEGLNLEGLATPDLLDVSETLPAGLTITPGAADGLVGCPAEGPEGFNQHSDAPGHCPLASQVGTAEATTPVLPGPLHGHVYFQTPGCGGVGQPGCTEADALNGTLFRILLELEGFGVVIKQPGVVAANPLTGQITATFTNAPQQPVEDVKLVFKGGPRAPLANPQECGPALTTSDLTPSSAPETPDANPSSQFTVTGCEGDPFKPGFLAGTTPTNAGAYTDFQVAFSREDREQDLSQISLHTPPGLLGMLSSVPLCGEPQASQGVCPAASQIATTSVAVGAGSHPLWVQGGRIYLTGPYGGEPFGLSVVVPAQAGPFNLGTVVLRGSIAIDPRTAALTVTTDPFPRILDGVPLRIRQVQVSVNRPGFMFNPTNCAQQQVTATLQSIQGASEQVSSPFAAGGCRYLPFDPAFTTSTRAKTSRVGGASLFAKVSTKAGEANIAKFRVELPRRLPARLTTLQKACTEAVFSANPAQCPSASLVGVARVRTPLLSSELSGPVYFVSNGGAKFPELEIVLEGEGLRVDVASETFISKAGITSATFSAVPDVPVGTFELAFPEGSHSALTAVGGLCAKALKIPTTITSQNGTVIHRATPIAVTGCPKAKKAKKARGARRSGKAARR
jgi:hypothetical protein